MARDLMTDGREVHAQARDVLDFWFGLAPERWWQKDDSLDAEIAARFSGLRDRVLADAGAGWWDHPDTLLAAIVLLDQFSRNIHRGEAEAFAGDDLAERLTLAAIEKNWADRYPPDRRAFLYMPLMHAEDAALQDLSVARFEALADPKNLAYARDHRAVFTRFGRFPGRNAALGRTSRAEELVYLATDRGW